LGPTLLSDNVSRVTRKLLFGTPARGGRTLLSDGVDFACVPVWAERHDLVVPTKAQK